MVNVWPGTGGLPSLKISPHRLLTSFKRKKKKVIEHWETYGIPPEPWNQT